jgi:hypothetical protein
MYNCEERKARMTPQPSSERTVNLTPIMTRYTDAYRIAKAIAAVGETIKIVAIIAGALMLLVGFGGASSFFGGASILFGLFLGVIVGGGGFILGILLSAQGQVLKATLDTAVNSSPFLENIQRAEIMSLS